MSRRLPSSSLLLFALLFIVSSSGMVSADDVSATRRGDPEIIQPRLMMSEASAVLPEDAKLVPLDPGIPSGIAPFDPGAKTATVLLSDGFEGSWPVSPWYVTHNQGYAEVDWGKSSYRKASGTYSIWPGATGLQSPGAGGNLPVNMYSWAIVGPFDLSNVTAGTLEFDLWRDTESDHDFIKWLASTDGQTFNGIQGWGTSNGFDHISQDLTDFGSANDLTGLSQVYFGFLYQSDGANPYYEGAYIDNVVLDVSGGGGGGGCGTYVIDDDNDNNSYSGQPDGDWHQCVYNDEAVHPIEFHIDINEASAQSAQLLLLCNDVDEEGNASVDPEVDNVYINNTFLGTLTGADGEDSTTVLTVPVSSLIVGRNVVRIDVDQHPNTSSDWCVELKQAQLIIDGGCEGSASCRYVNTDSQSYDPGDTVTINYEIDTNIQTGPQDVRVESNIVAPGGNIVAGTERNFTINGTANEQQSVSLSLPSNAEAGTYRVEILVFDKNTGRLDTSCDSTFTVTGGSNCNLTCSASVPSTGQVNVPITFSANATASGCSENPTYYWNGDTSTTASAPGQTVQITYDQPGTYNWELIVVADNERCVKNGTITITAGSNCNLSCGANVPATGQVNVPINFTSWANATGCAENPAFFWFPDTSTTATDPNQNIQITYDQPGTYNWQLVVVADNERCEVNGSITISGGGGGNCTYSYWVAVASRATGQNNSLWRTDLGLLGLSTATANVELSFFGPNGLRTRTTTVGGLNQIIITDVVNWVAPGTNGSGAILVCSDRPLYVSSRTYNQLPPNDPCFPNATFGQFIGSLTASAGIGGGQTAWLPQLVENYWYRTNIGLMNMGTSNSNVRVTLYDGTGRVLATYTENLTPGEWSQKTQPFYSYAGMTNMSAGSAYVEVLSGSGVIAYASVLDNFTNDGTTIWMVR